MLRPGILLQRRYKIVRLLNSGGTATVYEAADSHLKIAVALKELRPTDQHIQHMLAREAHILARLRHPALPIVLDSFVEHERLYVVLQLIAGPDLSVLMAQRRAPFPLDQVLRWTDQLLDALTYLHQQRPAIIHRDIKPHNLKLNDTGDIMLLDFGLAKGAVTLNTKIVAGAPSIVGYTLQYAPLEQIRGEGTDERSDLFSLAATLYECISGIRPPDALERATVLLSGGSDPLTFTPLLQARIPAAVIELLRSALSLVPSKRPSSAVVFRQTLSNAAGLLAEVQPISIQPALQDTTADLATNVSMTTTTPVSRALPTGTISFLCMRMTVHATMHDEEMNEVESAAVTASRMILHEFGGTVFKTANSMIWAAFADATDALVAALHSQQSLKQYAILAAQALHSGIAEERDGGYFGAVVDRTEQLLVVCYNEQIVLSHAIALLVRDRLPPDVLLRDLGKHRFKGLARPEHLFQAVSPYLPSDFPPPRTLDRRIGNLPLPSDVFVGREQELAAVCRALRQPATRLLTLTGPGGTGKTRLALEAAAEVVDHFADGICFVPLASIRDPILVASTIAQALGVEEMGSQSLEDTLKSYLQSKHLLLVLDNFEQIVPAAPLVDVLLTIAPYLFVLVTSREPLHLLVEQTFPVPPLAVPDADRFSIGYVVDTITTLAHYGAVALFAERARSAQPSFVLTSHNVAAVAAICRRLDGLPLAIELAAARIRLFAPAALLARLNGAYHATALRVLRGNDEEYPARQQTLQQVVAWSYDLLDHAEQTVFRQLAVFVGGCTVEAAEAVLQDSSHNTQSTLIDILASLLDKSLLRREEQLDGEPRFVLLETIREYCLEQLASRNESDTLRRNHATFYLEQAERSEPELKRADQMLWLNRLDREHDNMRAVLAWANTSGDTQCGLQLASALGPFWVTRGYLTEGQQRLSIALAQALEPSTTRAKALHAAGNLCFHQSDFPRASSYYEASLKLHQVLEDRTGQAWALHGLGRMQRTYEQAHQYLSQSLSFFRELGDQAGAAAALNELGVVERWRGAYEVAQGCHEESVTLFRALGDQIGLTNALSYLAQVLMQQGQLASARACAQEGVAVCQQVGSKLHLAWVRQSLGGVASAQGDLVAARAVYAENLALFRTLNDRAGIGWSLYDQGRVMLRGGDYAAARALLEESLALFRPMNDIWGTPWALTMLGITVLSEGDRLWAQACFAESLPLFRKSGNKQGMIFVLEGWGRMLMEEDAVRAAQLFGAATHARETLRMPLTPADRPAHDRDMARVRAQLTAELFEEAWAVGCTLTLDHATRSLAKEPA